MFELLEKLVNTNGVSGDEHRVREIIKEKAQEFCDDIRVDNIGNLIAHKPCENAKKVMICAHMDEVGFIVSAITDEGYLKFKAVGGIDADVLPAKQVLIGEKGVRGVVAVRPKHLIRDGKSEKNKITDLFIDIGVENKKEAEEVVCIGDYAYFIGDYEEFGNGCIKAKALDDRVGCMVLLELLKENLPYDVHFVWTVQEEVGCRGADALAMEIAPDLAIVVESTMCSDLPKTPDDKVCTRIGEGPALSIVDPRCIYDKTATKSLHEYGKNNDIKVQYKTAIAGGNDSSKIHLKTGGVRTIAVNIPCRYIHSPLCVASRDDITASYNLIKGWLNDGRI